MLQDLKESFVLRQQQPQGAAGAAAGVWGVRAPHLLMQQTGFGLLLTVWGLGTQRGKPPGWGLGQPWIFSIRV